MLSEDENSGEASIDHLEENKLELPSGDFSDVGQSIDVTIGWSNAHESRANVIPSGGEMNCTEKDIPDIPFLDSEAVEELNQGYDASNQSNTTERVQQLHILLMELRATVALVSFAVNTVYRRLSRDLCLHTSSSEIMPPNNQLGIRVSNPVDDVSNSTADLSLAYCDRLRPLQFGEFHLSRLSLSQSARHTVDCN